MISCRSRYSEAIERQPAFFAQVGDVVALAAVTARALKIGIGNHIRKTAGSVFRCDGSPHVAPTPGGHRNA